MPSRPGKRRIPDVAVERLSLYERELARLQRRGVGFVSSRRLAEELRLSDAQLRRDLSYFGQFGTSGRGYEVQRLQAALGQILGIQGRTWPVALAGVGNLGSALLAYRGFRERGFAFKVAFDSSAARIGQVIEGVPIESSARLVERVRQLGISIGVIAVPSEAAQGVCDQFLRAGVRGIVNFAPARLEVPATVRLRSVDLAIELEALAFYLGQGRAAAKSRNGRG